MENIGDIDLDGLSDLAVSAPYEEVRNENGDVIATGRVYIYRGSRSGVVADDVQVSHVIENIHPHALAWSLSSSSSSLLPS